MDNNPPKIPRQLQPKKMRTDAEKLEIISRQKDSGLSVSVFCKQEGLHATQFYAWKKKLVQSTSSINKDFIKVKPPVNVYPLELYLPNGIRLKASKSQVDAQLIKSLMEL